MWKRLLAVVILEAILCIGNATEFTVGYLTGSARLPGNLLYEKPGRSISGAITLAVEEVNQKLLNPRGHSLKFKASDVTFDFQSRKVE